MYQWTVSSSIIELVVSNSIKMSFAFIFSIKREPERNMQMNEKTTLSTSSLIQFVFLWLAVKGEGGFMQLPLNTLARVCVGCYPGRTFCKGVGIRRRSGIEFKQNGITSQQNLPLTLLLFRIFLLFPQCDESFPSTSSSASFSWCWGLGNIVQRRPGLLCNPNKEEEAFITNAEEKSQYTLNDKLLHNTSYQ